MTVKQLTVEDELQTMVGQDEALLLKHSLTCPISDEAKKQFEKFTEESDIPAYIIHIQENRELSNLIAEQFDIKHESPQVFYFKNGQVEFHASHWDVTAKKLTEVTQ
ncbi:bacillithiol system redox-active protein YtxJ [Alkalibacillus aidingensis]|uniref:bacillithiol system redox-active protein YtxJ n=1 Tax=Alkalibacillus aidingensis TaxID=2747607 RepID=UPI00166091DE|nr:bacillithiol system redox-active protein YtxJ [Alkalibacillus aidingensis]